MPEIVLVRHGQTDWSRDGKHTGLTDVPLTGQGRREAELLRSALGGWCFGRVLTSPLARAAETCRLAGLGERAESCHELVEWDYGEYEGLTTPEIRARRPGWLLWRDGCPDGEQPRDVGARVDPLVDELGGLGADAAVFGHGHALRVLAARWCGLEPAYGRLLVLVTGTLSVLGYEHEWHALRRWNAPA